MKNHEVYINKTDAKNAFLNHIGKTSMDGYQQKFIDWLYNEFEGIQIGDVFNESVRCKYTESKTIYSVVDEHGNFVNNSVYRNHTKDSLVDNKQWIIDNCSGLYLAKQETTSSPITIIKKINKNMTLKGI